MKEDTSVPMVPGGGPKPVLAAEYTFDILAPAGVPRKYLHVELSSMTAVLETEFGRQEARDFRYDPETHIFSFQALLGSQGNELFEVRARLYGGGVALAEAAMIGEGYPKSPAVFREIEAE